MRRHINYANVTATLALIFAMSGGALAASHYLIKSTKQISPKVLRALKGKRGPRGATGATGATGTQGKEGALGKEGTAGKEGSPGKEGTAGKEGKEGPQGPSDAYEASSPIATNVTSTPKTLSVVLPAGSYDISGKAQEENRDLLHTATLRCKLTAGGEELDSMLTDSASATPLAPGRSANVVHAGLTTAGVTVTMSCARTASESTEVFVVSPTLSAIKVGALH